MERFVFDVVVLDSRLRGNDKRTRNDKSVRCVTPAQAGVQMSYGLDSRLRGNDKQD